jgi:hypothetical protein
MVSFHRKRSPNCSLLFKNFRKKKKTHALLKLPHDLSRPILIFLDLISLILCEPIIVTARSKASNVFALSNTGIVCSNPTRGIDVCLRLFCVCDRKRSCDVVIPSRRRPTSCLRLRNWSETTRFIDCQNFKYEQQNYVEEEYWVKYIMKVMKPVNPIQKRQLKKDYIHRRQSHSDSDRRRQRRHGAYTHGDTNP